MGARIYLHENNAATDQNALRSDVSHQVSSAWQGFVWCVVLPWLPNRFALRFSGSLLDRFSVYNFDRRSFLNINVIFTRGIWHREPATVQPDATRNQSCVRANGTLWILGVWNLSTIFAAPLCLPALTAVSIILISCYLRLVIMVERCCVVKCRSASHDDQGEKINNGISFHPFPAWRQNEGSDVSELTKRRRMAWLSAVRTKHISFDEIPTSTRVCSVHFHSG